jgi:hypothetical protein
MFSNSDAFHPPRFLLSYIYSTFIFSSLAIYIFIYIGFGDHRKAWTIVHDLNNDVSNFNEKTNTEYTEFNNV